MNKSLAGRPARISKSAKNLSVIKAPKDKAAAYRKLFNKKVTGKKVTVK